MKAKELHDETPVTEEWLRGFIGMKMDRDTTLIPIGDDQYETVIAVESDFSWALQMNGYDDHSCQYIPLPGKLLTRGQLAKLLNALGGKP